MTKKIANRGLLAAVAASTLVAIIGALAFASVASAAPTITLSGTVSGSTVVVSANVSGTGANAVGGMVADFTFDSTKLTATACTPAACNLAPVSGAGHVSFATFDNLGTGLSGAVASVTLTINAGVTGAQTVGLTISQCTDGVGDARTDCSVSSITVGGATPTPSPSPSAAAATPSPTVAVFANTGGSPSDGSSSSALPLALAALGLVTVGGAAWAVARTRRIAG